MNWNDNMISNIVADFAEENAFACRALFRLADIRFTRKVKSLAVTLSGHPELLINREFINQYAETENDIKALLMHEFLHVLLLHTEKLKWNTPLINIALDAVINAIIHRTYGGTFSGFFARFYMWQDIDKLLRPGVDLKNGMLQDDWDRIHCDVYNGRYSGEDLYEFLRYTLSGQAMPSGGGVFFLGNHDSSLNRISGENGALLDGIVLRAGGALSGVVSVPGKTAGKFDHERVAAYHFIVNRWKAGVRKILEECFTADRQKNDMTEEEATLLPLLSSRDRRALSLLGWSGILPLASHAFPRSVHSGSVTVYIDVSGSMGEELRLLVAMLGSFRKEIRTPIWSFSTMVAPTVWSGGELTFKTTGGTSIGCVFDHLRINRYKKAVIITDGFVEEITPEMRDGIDISDIRVILTPGGNASPFIACGMKYHQLVKL